jgi:hypothetical protein
VVFCTLHGPVVGYEPPVGHCVEEHMKMSAVECIMRMDMDRKFPVPPSNVSRRAYCTMETDGSDHKERW